jgi:hypothetical protein
MTAFGLRSRVGTGIGSWLGAGLGVTTFGSFQSIATTTVGAGGQTTVTFSSIPNTFSHLQLRYMVRTNRASTEDIVQIRFNSDTGANYSRHYMYGDGTLGSGGVANETRILTDGCTAASATAGQFGVGIVDLLDYKDTNKFKTLRALTGNDRNGGGSVILNSGNWRSNSAISTITITSYYGADFVQYSSFALYGVKG